MTDFETSMQSAFENVFPNAVHTGCWFHYTHVNVKYTTFITSSIFFIPRLFSLDASEESAEVW